MKIIYNNWFPFGSYKIINLFGVLFSKDKTLDEIDINHESIHTEQFKELAIIGLILVLLLDLVFNIPLIFYLFGVSLFYIWYGIEYLIVRCFHKKQKDSYHDVSFEEEAYNNELDYNYLDNRKHFSWIKYLKVKST